MGKESGGVGRDTSNFPRTPNTNEAILDQGGVLGGRMEEDCGEKTLEQDSLP